MYQRAMNEMLEGLNHASKFLPMLAEVETPLRELTKRDVTFSSTGTRPKLKHSNGSKIYVAQPQYWHRTMLRKNIHNI